MRRIDASCELLEYFCECIDGECCVFEEIQYQNSPCNHYSPPGKYLNDLISDEEIVEIALFSDKVSSDLSKIYRDPVDVKIFIFSVNNNGTVVWSCDKNLLLLCKNYKVFHGCFKSAIKIADKWLDGAISKHSNYKLHLMDCGNDPFFHFNSDSRCESHCDCSFSSICYKRVNVEQGAAH
ncbi:MAG: hypothetical protein JXB25_05150 [Deltaproteobacteria bacterium]|nr:hypothetical protein [Deltaproteobacteria bacterium]